MTMLVRPIESCLLVASPSLTCPIFGNTVVLLVDHREDGSLGFVLNRPADIGFDEVLRQVGVEEQARGPLGGAVPGDTPVLRGGPVSPETGWVLYDPGDEPASGDDGVIRVGQHIEVCANVRMLRQIARGDGPARRTMMLGYAGWGPGQLDGEIREGSWIVSDLDPGFVFDVPVGERWTRAYAQMGI
ncbi:MAG: YqgE/AlgH family protein, partial [Myxococcales bacterium]|nr:YqgE/AlgH family protein [Myxococcales bacterium]